MEEPVRTPLRRAVVRLTLLLIVSAVTIFAVSAQAFARPSSISAGPAPTVASSGAITLSASRSAPQDGGVSPQLGTQINCNVSIDNPHNSGHNPGTVNVVSHVACDSIVSSIAITTRLFEVVRDLVEL